VTSEAPADAFETFAVLVNGDERAVRRGATVAELLGQLGLAGRRLAVAVNRDVVPRSGYAARRLAAGDRIEILEAVGGG
jgi:sulfur carrier protein